MQVAAHSHPIGGWSAFAEVVQENLDAKKEGGPEGPPSSQLLPRDVGYHICPLTAALQPPSPTRAAGPHERVEVPSAAVAMLNSVPLFEKAVMV